MEEGVDERRGAATDVDNVVVGRDRSSFHDQLRPLVGQVGITLTRVVSPLSATYKARGAASMAVRSRSRRRLISPTAAP
jgi:hypothetical protein